MVVQNDSGKVINEFVFTGFDTVQRPLAAGLVLLILFILVMIVNSANICFIITDKRLHQPMYLFICNLAFVDIIYSMSSCPTMIAILVVGHKTISFIPCIVQMYIFQVCVTMEAYAIAVMAFDRFIAIGNPLRYHTIMTNFRSILIIITLWMAAFAIIAILPASIAHLPVCFSKMKYIFCDYANIVRAICVDPEQLFNNVSILTTLLFFTTFSIICLSYLRIAIVVIRMPSNTAKKKALKTCLTHLIVIVCYYAPTLTRIVLTRIGVVLTVEERNGLMVGSIVGPSLVNPFTYCFRTKEIRNKIFKIFSFNIQPVKQKGLDTLRSQVMIPAFITHN